MKTALFLLLCFPAPISAQTPAVIESKLHGNWDLVKDDDQPEGTTVKKERLSIYPDGSFMISGFPMTLTYALQENRIVVTGTMGNESQVLMNREISVDETWLKLKNEKSSGWVSYKRSQDPLEPLVDTSVARPFEDALIKATIPAGWQNFQERDGTKQMYAFTHPSGGQMVHMVITPSEKGLDPFTVSEKMSGEMMANFPPEHRPDREAVEHQDFYGLKGKFIRFSKALPEGTVTMSFYTTLFDNQMVFLFAQEVVPANGSSATPIIKNLLASVQINGKVLSQK